MSVLTERQQTAEAIAKGRFVRHVLQQEASNIDTVVKERMQSFSSSFWSNRNLAVSDNKLTYTTLKKHRFIDMKTRQTKNGAIKKKHHQIHNKPIFGHLNNIIRELNIGFTEAVKQQFMSLDNKTL